MLHITITETSKSSGYYTNNTASLLARLTEITQQFSEGVLINKHERSGGLALCAKGHSFDAIKKSKPSRD